MFLILGLFVWYGYVQVPEESRRGVGCPEAEITGSCETPGMKPGNLTGSFGKSKRALTHKTISPAATPLVTPAPGDMTPSSGLYGHLLVMLKVPEALP